MSISVSWGASILGKRKHRDSPSRSKLSLFPVTTPKLKQASQPSSACSSGTETEVDESYDSSNNPESSDCEENVSTLLGGGTRPTSSTTSLVSTTKKTGRPKRYICSHEGCSKAYTKPSRLAEHERSHTGQVSLHTLASPYCSC